MNKTDFDIKIKLKVKGVDIELDRDEARELKHFLDELFDKRIQYWPYRWPKPYYSYNDEPLYVTRDAAAYLSNDAAVSCEVS